MVDEMVLVTHRTKGSRAGGGRYLGENKERRQAELRLGRGPAKARAGALQCEEERGCWETRAEGAGL